MKILVVDDEPLIRRSLVRAFRQVGHEVFESEDGNRGLEIWQKEKPDLVVLDVLMPGLTGPQMITRQPQSPHPPKIVLMSAFTGETNAESAKEIGADLFVEKPFKDIFAVVDKILSL